MTDEPRPSTPKADPEALVLRAAPPRALRFRRGVVIALAAGAMTAIAAVSWLALRPADVEVPDYGEQRGPVAATGPGDALAGAPPTYGDVPKLGPPLPGDLGRPILRHQRDNGLEPVDPAAEAAARAAAQAEAERQREAAERKAARESSVMLGMGKGVPAQAADGAASALPSNAVAAGLAQKLAEDVSSHRLTAAASPWTLHAGSIISASLITGLNSDLPGFVTAQVTENVYDSVRGETLLIPQGARLIGRYDNVVAYGQSRAFLVWQRLIMPDGSSIRLDDIPATDGAGYAGLSDRIDRHGWQLLKGVMLSTLLGVGTELGSGGSDDNLVSAIREASQQSGSRAGDQIVGRSLDIKPTLRVRPGWPLRVIVHKDIVLQPWGGR